MPIRIALFGIYHESNTFIDQPTTIEDFRKGHWMKGDEILVEYRHAFHEIGGMIEVLEKNQVELVPLSFAEATPGGKISKATFDQLLMQITREIQSALPVHGCIIALHGAAVSESYADMDGHWLSEIRSVVGNEIPMVGTLDPHANVSEKMVTATNALISYSTNPHTDQRETGKKAASILLEIIHGRIQPLQRLVQSPVAISIEQQHTASNPCLSLYAHVDKIKSEEGMLHISINLGFPYADVKEMGTSFIILQDRLKRQPAGPGNAEQQLVAYMMANKAKFVGNRLRIKDILPLLDESNRPVLLLDMGDNIGGGAPGNSLHLLRTLEGLGKYRSLCSIYAPETIATLMAQPDDEVQVVLSDEYGEDLPVSGQILKVVDGKFSESNPRHGGQVHYDMGASIIIETTKGNTLLLMSNRVPPFSLQQLTSFDLHPENYDVVVAKGVIAPMAAYGPVCKTIFQVDTPGKTQVNMTGFPYQHRRKPLYPFEGID